MNAEKIFRKDGEYIIVSDEAVTNDYLMGLSIRDNRPPTWGMYWKDGEKFGDRIEFSDLPEPVKQIWDAEVAIEEAP